MTRKKVLSFGLSALAAIGLGAVFLAAMGKSPSARITVIDQGGRPVAGAIVTPNGLRSKGGASHFHWSTNQEPRPLPHTTDSQGCVTVGYPGYVMEDVETGTITFEVDHPDFAWQHAEQVVDHSPISKTNPLLWLRFFLDRLNNAAKFRTPPVVLKRGGAVQASGYIGSQEQAVTINVYADPNFRLDWKLGAEGVLDSKRFAPGTNFLRLVHLSSDRGSWFSDRVSFVVGSGSANICHLELKPGLRLEVRLSDQVPRPVLNGRVVVWVGSDHTLSPPPPVWRAWRELNTNGVCVFESLPPGNVEIIGICDGFISVNGPVVPNRGPHACRPQVLPEGEGSFGLKMEPTAICKIQVLDPDRKPLPGARVFFCPNVIGGGIFARHLVNSEDQLRDPPTSPFTQIDSFSGITDAEGRAVIDTLPGFGQQEFLYVEHPDFEMAMEQGSEWRHSRVMLRSGKTTPIDVVMEKRGSKPARNVP